MGAGRTTVRFRVLGPVRAVDAGQDLALPGPRVRTLLALLVLRANNVVTVKELTERLWEDGPPRNPRAAIHTLVGRLRDVLEDRSVPRLIETGPDGYVLRVLPEQVDLLRFRELVARSATTDDPVERAGRLDAALALWAGRPLDDLESPRSLADKVAQLTEERLRTVELLVDTRLRLGQAEAVIPRLRQLTEDHPLRERFWGQLVLALHQTGRSTEAARAYGTISRMLAEQLGVDPGAELQQLRREVLAGTPAVVPAQLPGDVAGFAGRADALARLDALLDAVGENARAPVALITGTAGVGKTALAVRWAHRVKTRFPDGQLYADLKGYAPEPPADPAQVLAGFLRALGVADIPAGSTAREELLKRQLAGRRMLIVLDNAADAAQVRPLLPADPASRAVITSRDTLPELGGAIGPIRLDRLPAAEAGALLESLLPDRAIADPGAVRMLVKISAGLPLVLRLVGELVLGRPGSDLGWLVAELADDRRRLDRLTGGDDPRSALRAVFSWSCRRLSGPAVRAFRLTGERAGAVLEPVAVAEATGMGVDEARAAIAELLRANLVERRGAGRVAPHDLLRSYAAELAAARPAAATGWSSAVTGTFHRVKGS